MKKQLTLLLFLILLFSLSAQTKQLTLEDAIVNRYWTLAPDKLTQLQWLADENAFSYINDNQLIKETISGNKETLFNLKTLNALLQRKSVRLPHFSWIKNDRLLFSEKSKSYIIDKNATHIIATFLLPDDAKNQDFCIENNTYAYTKANNLYIKKNNIEIAITSDSVKAHVYGQGVSRNEFGISKGTFWSPKGNYLAFYKKDESDVSNYPLVNFMTRAATYNPIKYPMAGMASEHVDLGVYDMGTGNIIYIDKQGGSEDYLTNITWSPCARYLFVQELNRAQNHMRLNQFDAKTGAFVKTLFEEKSKKYVEPQHPIQFSRIKPNEFYYWSNVDGYFHVYKYNTTGKRIKQLTQGRWEVTDMLGFDEKERFLFVETTKESPLERHVYRVDTRYGKMKKLTNESGTHTAKLSPKGNYLLDNFQSTEIPSIVNLISEKGKIVRNLLTSKDNADEYRFGKNNIVEIPCADDKNILYGRIILPPDFDASRKYPVIVYVYGGPHAQLVQKTWKNAVQWWQYYIAQKGYITFTLDNRGTPNRGREFENVIHRQLGKYETEDQMAGINYLKSLPYVDSRRIGIHGWSFGGFMSINLKLRYPDVFKVAVAGGPVIDWKLYEVMYGERYMDTPQENPEGYNDANLLHLVPQLNEKLLIIHGAQDNTVVMQHSMQFIRECVKQGKQVDFFSYPTHSHNVSGYDRVHLMQKVTEYFEENL